MNDVVLPLIGGLIVGVVVVVLLMLELVRGQVAAQVQQWQVKELYAVRHDALDKSRPEVQRRVGTTIASWTHSFPFLQEDSRFLGHPIDYVVFEGSAQVRAKQEQQITCVTFVRAREDGRDDPDGRLVEECVKLGRVEWRTLEMTQNAVSARRPAPPR